MLQCRHDAALKRERALAYAFSNQVWRSDRNHPSSSMSIGEEREVEGGEELDQRPPKWLDRWIASRPSWDHNPNNVTSSSSNYRGRRASTDQRDSIKTLEIDTGRPFSHTSISSSTTNFRRHHHHPNSPLHGLHRSHLQHSPATPSPSKMHPLQVRSASPRCGREDRLLHSSVHSPSSHYSYQSTNSTAGLRLHYQQVQNQFHYQQQHPPVQAIPVPNYMAATESAKARVRSQSAPRQRSSTPERDRSSVGLAKKRLSFPAPEPYDGGGSVTGSGVGYSSKQEHRGSNMKNVMNGGRFGSEQRSNVSSSCTDSFGGEISPSSTTDLRRWLR